MGESATSAPSAAAPLQRRMDAFLDAIEWVAALFVGLVAADVFVSVLLRNLFSIAIPDGYDFGRMLLGYLPDEQQQISENVQMHRDERRTVEARMAELIDEAGRVRSLARSP